MAWLMISPMNVDTSLDRDSDGLFRRSSGLSEGNAAGSSGTVTVYECRRDGMSDGGGGGVDAVRVEKSHFNR